MSKFSWGERAWFWCGEIGKSHKLLLAALKEIDKEDKRRKALSSEEKTIFLKKRLAMRMAEAGL